MNQNINETYHGKKIDTSNIFNIEDASKMINKRRSLNLNKLKTPCKDPCKDLLREK